MPYNRVALGIGIQGRVSERILNTPLGITKSLVTSRLERVCIAGSNASDYGECDKNAETCRMWCDLAMRKRTVICSMHVQLVLMRVMRPFRL